MTTRRRWSDEETAQLKSMWVAGKSGGTIAVALNRTRSSVMGKGTGIGLFGMERDLTAHTKLPSGEQSLKGNKGRPKTWSDDALTEKWADRKKRKTG